MQLGNKAQTTKLHQQSSFPSIGNVYQRHVLCMTSQTEQKREIELMGIGGINARCF